MILYTLVTRQFCELFRERRHIRRAVQTKCQTLTLAWSQRLHVPLTGLNMQRGRGVAPGLCTRKRILSSTLLKHADDACKRSADSEYHCNVIARARAGRFSKYL